MLSTFLSTLIGKLLVGSVALAAATGGVAATGNLPDQAQAWASETLEQIGIEIPAPTGEIPTPEDDVDRSGDVLDVVEGTDPEDRDQEFGEDVADTASDGNSSENLDRAGDASNDKGDVADDFVPDEADEPADDLPEEAEQGADAADEHAGDRRP